MELDARETLALDRSDDGATVVDVSRDGRRIDGLDRVAVGEVDILAVETVEERRRARHRERVPAHVRDALGAQATDRPFDQAEPTPALVALVAEELHPDADAEHRTRGGDPVADRVVEPIAPEALGRALDVSD